MTGAAAGLGRVLALALARSGARLVLSDIDGDGLVETARQVGHTDASGRADVRVADVGSEHDVAALFDHVDRTCESVDMLFNVAGVNPLREAPERFPVEAWNSILRVNLTGTLLCAQAAARRMRSSGRGGSIVNVSSIAATTSLGRGNVAYAASKAAIHQLTRDLAVAWAPYGIRVNSVQPAQIDGPAWQAWREDPVRAVWLQGILAGIPAGRMPTAEEIVWPALFLASDAATMITGSALPVDGGNLALNAGAVQPGWTGGSRTMPGHDR